jgi:hypothetical protein
MTKKPDTGRRRPPGRNDATKPSSAVGGRCHTMTAQQFESETPEVVFDIQLLDGLDGEALAHQQARVLREVTAWLAQNSSASGRTTAQ